MSVLSLMMLTKKIKVPSYYGFVRNTLWYLHFYYVSIKKSWFTWIFLFTSLIKIVYQYRLGLTLLWKTLHWTLLKKCKKNPWCYSSDSKSKNTCGRQGFCFSIWKVQLRPHNFWAFNKNYPTVFSQSKINSLSWYES